MAACRPYVLIVLPLALAACGGGSKHAVGNDVLAKAADATSRQASEQVGVQAKIDLSGQPLTLGGDGAFAKQRGKLHLKFDLGGLGSSTLDEIFQGNVVWLSSPLLESQLQGKHWVKLDLSKPVKAFGFNLNVLAAQTPSSALAKLRLKGKVSSLGTESVGGVQTTHYRETLSASDAGGVYKSVDAWVDDHDLVRKLKLDYGARVDPTSKSRAHTVLTMTFSDFGTPVTASPPAPGDVVDSSALGAK